MFGVAQYIGGTLPCTMYLFPVVAQCLGGREAEVKSVWLAKCLGGLFDAVTSGGGMSACRSTHMDI